MKNYQLSPKWCAYFIINLYEGMSYNMAISQANNDYLTKRGIYFSYRQARIYRFNKADYKKKVKLYK